MCPYTHLQGLQEVQVRDSVRPTRGQREVAIAEKPEAADTVSKLLWFWNARRGERATRGASQGSPIPTMIDSKPQSMQPHLQSRPAHVMECHEEAMSPQAPQPTVTLVGATTSAYG